MIGFVTDHLRWVTVCTYIPQMITFTEWLHLQLWLQLWLHFLLPRVFFVLWPYHKVCKLWIAKHTVTTAVDKYFHIFSQQTFITVLWFCIDLSIAAFVTTHEDDCKGFRSFSFVCFLFSCCLSSCIFVHYTHTHPFNGPFFWDYPGWAGTRKVEPICILLKQETVSGSAVSWTICKSAPSSS